MKTAVMAEDPRGCPLRPDTGSGVGADSDPKAASSGKGKNDIFGEMIHLYAKPGKSNADVRALSYCDLHIITREDLLEVLDMYPEFSDHFLANLELTFNLRDESSKTSYAHAGSDSEGEDNSKVKRKISFSFEPSKGGCNKQVESESRKERRDSRLSSKRGSDISGTSREEQQRSLAAGIIECPSVEGPDSTYDCTPTANKLDRESYYDDRQSDVWENARSREPTEESKAQAYELREETDEELDSDLTYGEVQHRLDSLQEHLNRLESQMTSDIRAILYLLQKQSPVCPPTYNTVIAVQECKTSTTGAQSVPAALTRQTSSPATQESIQLHSSTSNQTVLSRHQHSKSLLPIHLLSPTDAPVSSTEAAGHQRPLSDPGLPNSSTASHP